MKTALLAGIFLSLFTTVIVLAAPQTPENQAQNVNFNTDGSDPSKYYGQWPGHHYFPSPHDWRDVGIYQLLTDRFRDGKPENNDLQYGGYDLYDVGMRHGGDFTGLQESLPYIKSLGYDAIWISPVFQNRFNSYHSYAQIDFTLLDARFGTLADFRALVDRAHELGMYVIADIVINHMDNLLYFEGHENTGAPFRMHTGEYRQFPRHPNEVYADFKVDNTFHDNGTYGDVYGYDGFKKTDNFGQGSYWFSDFNHNGNLDDYDDPWQNHLGKIYGIMDDLRTTHTRVQDKIIAMSKALISSTDIDGMRIDTPMQVPLQFFKRWVPAVKGHARSLGKDNFFIFGEFYCPRARSATMVGRGKTPEHHGNGFAFIDDVPTMDAGINYDFYFNFIGPALKAQQGGVDAAKKHLDADLNAYDFYNPARRELSYTMLNFYNNHDQWRLNWEADGFQKSRLGSAIIAFWPGIPLFYYGDEQALASEGSALDGRSREDFMTAKAWYDIKSRAPHNPANADNFNMTHPEFLYVQKVMNVRKQYFALRNTHEIVERWVQKDNGNGIYAYSRLWGDEKNWAFVAFNTWKFSLEAGGQNGTLYTGWKAGDEIVNALQPTERIVLEKDGVIPTLKLDGYETKVFVRADNLQPLNPVVTTTTPNHDAVTALGEKNIVVTFSEPMTATSLATAVYYDGQPIPAGDQSLSADLKTLTFAAQVTPGIHKVVIRAAAKATNQKPLFADFTSRFRAGEPSNALVTTQKDPLSDPALVVRANTAADGKTLLTLRHQADGAEKLRVSTDDGKQWSAWEVYQSETQHRVHGVDSSHPRVLVQYWADGSAAYFVKN